MTDILDEVVVDEFAREADRRMGFCDGCGPAVHLQHRLKGELNVERP